MKQLAEKLDLLTANKIELVVVSADSVAISEAFAATHGLTFPVGAGLTESQMRDLGLYVSSPKDYQPQDHLFSEPAFFLLTPTGIIRYVEVASFPMGGRPNVDNLIAGVQWVEEEKQRVPAFADNIWGSK
jgi:peroxiredoxin